MIQIPKLEEYSSMNAKQFQDYICGYLSVYGSIKREVKVPNRGDGRGGRIDCVFTSTGGVVTAIEIDRNTPRTKSLYKLAHFTCDKRVIITRTPFQILELD